MKNNQRHVLVPSRLVDNLYTSSSPRVAPSLSARDPTKRLTILRMDEIYFAQLCNHWKPLSVGICRGIIIRGLLEWCKISLIHTRGKPEQRP